MLLAGSPPTNLAISPNYVDENQPVGTVVGHLSASDADLGDTLSYALVDEAKYPDNTLFRIAGDQLKTATSFDYETKATCTIRVRVTDSYGNTLDGIFTVVVDDVNDAPRSLRLTPSSVYENQPAGTFVGTLSAIDPDKGDTLTYSLVPGVGDTDNVSFTIEGTQLKTAERLDHEANATCSVLVRATDSRGLWTDKSFSITVSQTPSAPNHSYTVLQNTEFAVEAPGVLQDAVPAGVKAMIVSKPAHGTLRFNSDGSFAYRPSTNYLGTDRFTYKVFDGKLYSTPAVVNITVDSGPDAVVQTPSVVVGGNNLVLACVGDYVRLVNFGTRQVLLNRDASTLNSLTVLGVDNRADMLTIDASASGFLPGGVTFQGGSGAQADTLVLRGSAGADTVALGADSAAINALEVGFSNVEQVLLDGGAGDDVYEIAALPINATISDRKGADTLDFFAAPTGVTIDLGKTSKPQKIFATTTRTLTLKGKVENVIGSESSDWIKGSSAGNRLEGRGGDDAIYGGSGNDALLGGEGDDRLDAGAGRNLLIGGLGSDTLQGRSGQELLIGGTTLYDDDALALAAIIREWTSTRSFRKRCDNLAVGINDPAAGIVLLEKGTTVLDDGDRDELFGGLGSDWFFDFPADIAHDHARNDR